jgi:hypothetical protein
MAPGCPSVISHGTLKLNPAWRGVRLCPNPAPPPEHDNSEHDPDTIPIDISAAWSKEEKEAQDHRSETPRRGPPPGIPRNDDEINTSPPRYHHHYYPPKMTNTNTNPRRISTPSPSLPPSRVTVPTRPSVTNSDRDRDHDHGHDHDNQGRATRHVQAPNVPRLPPAHPYYCVFPSLPTAATSPLGYQRGGDTLDRQRGCATARCICRLCFPTT